MKSAISIGGDILTVDIVRTTTGYEASCVDRVLDPVQRRTASGETYDEAIVALRDAVLKSRRCI
jgi:hypothetical protein